MGIGSVFGLLKSIEWFLWIFIGIISAIIMAKYVVKRQFSHGFYLGLINVLLVTLIQVLFFDEFLANNSHLAERLESFTISIKDRLLYFLIAPFTGLISGLILGLMTFSAAKIISASKKNEF